MANRLLSAGSLFNNEVRNLKGEKLGKIEEIMIDFSQGRVGYAVLSCGGLLGIGDKLIAVPWSALRLDTDEEIFVLDVDKETIDEADGFDKDNWPDFASVKFGTAIHERHNARPYWK